MRKWLPLAAVCLGSFMLIVDTTVVTVALPEIGTDLHASLSSLQWVMNVYTLVLAALTLSAGCVGDLLGRRKVYLLSLAVFGGSSLLCAVAPDLGLLIAARGLQGVGGAAMFVASMALLGTTYDGKDRGTAMGVWSAVIGAAAAVGPIFGGLLTQAMSWRAIFYVNIPISLLTILLTKACFEESRPLEGARVDLAGILTFALSCGSLTYALIRAGDDGWSSPSVLGLFALARPGRGALRRSGAASPEPDAGPLSDAQRLLPGSHVEHRGVSLGVLQPRLHLSVVTVGGRPDADQGGSGFDAAGRDNLRHFDAVRQAPPRRLPTGDHHGGPGPHRCRVRHQRTGHRRELLVGRHGAGADRHRCRGRYRCA
ncbi:hypothetical protein GCM10020000_80050 [Streptomyces olivoverticillatus]